jgi:hypothetical protein
VSGFFLHSFIDFLRAEQLFVIGKRAAHSLTDRARLFARERQNVGQKGFNAPVHQFPPLGRLRATYGIIS